MKFSRSKKLECLSDSLRHSSTLFCIVFLDFFLRVSLFQFAFFCCTFYDASWSIREKQVANGVPAGLFFALGAGAVACGLAVFEAAVVPAQKEAEKKNQQV
jgi:hypothetical protein